MTRRVGAAGVLRAPRRPGVQRAKSSLAAATSCDGGKPFLGAMGEGDHLKSDGAGK